ncbi:MAG TPA: Holliday junction resolvase RuvX [Candidatus Sulfomarinibacteraceae bacterium]|nr:Holliday junction resolvase RuvX [Candidatus Sulfomarinibacteraceae bacterium]
MTEQQPPSEKRIMALDLGEKRIGVALSDEMHLIARSYTVVERTSRDADYEQFAAIVAEEDVGYLVVGLPVQLDGEEGQVAAWVRDYTTELAGRLGIGYTFWDESFTTEQASASMRERGTRAREQRDWIDAVAAAFILQDYLDARRRRGLERSE